MILTKAQYERFINIVPRWEPAFPLLAYIVTTWDKIETNQQRYTRTATEFNKSTNTVKKYVTDVLKAHNISNINDLVGSVLNG